MSIQWNYPPEAVKDRYLRLTLHGRVQGKFGFPNLPLPLPQSPSLTAEGSGFSSPPPNVQSTGFLSPVPIGLKLHCSDSFACCRMVERPLFIDIQNRLLYDKTAWCTTFFDYYGLSDDFPGKQKTRGDWILLGSETL